MRSRIQFGFAALLAVAVLVLSGALQRSAIRPATTTPAHRSTARCNLHTASQRALRQPASGSTRQHLRSPPSSESLTDTSERQGEDQTGPASPGGSAGTAKRAGDKAAADAKSTDAKNDTNASAKTDVLPSPGEALDPHIKKGSEDDVDAIGTRNIGGRGLGNWYSVNGEIGMGKQYSMEIEKSAHLVTDPVVTEYVNRIGQNIVKNSDCKVPFTIKVIDSDEINAMALPGGFFYVNSGLILAADEEAELAGVMAHETAHVCAHHAAREMTRMNYARDRLDPADHLHPGLVDGLRDLRGVAAGDPDQLPGVLARVRGRGRLAWPAVYVQGRVRSAGLHPVLREDRRAGEAQAGHAGQGLRRPSADAGPHRALRGRDCDDHAGPSRTTS